MRSLSSLLLQLKSLQPALLAAGLLFAACSEAPGQSGTIISQTPSDFENDTSAIRVPSDIPATTSPEPVNTIESSPAEAGRSELPSTERIAPAQAYSTRKPASSYADLEIATLLPRDAIPAIDNPSFLSAAEADEFYDPDELVLGVSFNGDSRAYSAPFLSNHEIVNDTVGGVKIAITW